MKNILFAIVTFCLAWCAFIMPAQAADKPVLNIQNIKTSSGIEIWLVEDHSIPVISMDYSFDGGLAYDPEDKPGVAYLTSILMDEGAGDMNSQTFQQQLSDNAISLGFTPGRDAFMGRLKTLSANRDLAFKLLHLALTAPRFDADAIERMKQAASSDIAENLGDPSWLVARTFNGMVFEDHYYAQPGTGSLASIAAITRDDLKDYVAAQFTRNVLHVSIVGDVTAAEAAALINGTFADLPEKAAAVELKPAELHYPGKTILLPLDAPQTYVSTALRGIARGDKDWEAANIMNFIFGGSDFNARLMHEIREKRGLTYGVYSSLVTMDQANTLQISLSASNEKVQEALQLISSEMARLAKDGPTSDEVKNAKAYLTGSLPLQLTSTSDISGVLASLQRDHLPIDYLNRRNALLNAVSADDIKRVAAQMLKPENMTTILVGQPKNINVDILLDKPPGMKEPLTKDNK